jgi:hypothetical protein
MLYREEPDGSAFVHGIAVAPFVPVQHMQIDISTVNRLGNYCFRFARERGWLQTSEELAQATPYAERNEARPLIESEGHAYHDTDNTFFFAGVEEALANPHPHFHYPPTPSTLFASAHFWLVHVGNSSYGVFCKLYTYLDGQTDLTQHLLGTFKVTTVWVSKAQRTPAQLTQSKRTLFQSIMAKEKGSGAPVCGDEVRVQRLDARALLQCSGWFDDATAVATLRLNSLAESSSSSPPPSDFSVSVPGVETPLNLLVRRCFTLRETDIDFNLHVNQLVSKLFVIDAFRGAVADTTCAYSRLLRPGELAICSDLLLRRFRIDYVREIPMRYAAVEVYLFPLHAEVVKHQLHAACGKPAEVLSSSPDSAEEAEMMEIGFFTLGVTNSDDLTASSSSSSSGKFVATVGVMAAATCFLPQTMQHSTSSI